LNSDCRRRTFSDREAAVATPYARRTSRQAQLLGHMAHAAVGTPAERLLRRLVSTSKQVAFAEKLARIKRRAVPDECFRDKGLMSKWIDGNK
jgi:hypothetical protein